MKKFLAPLFAAAALMCVIALPTMATNLWSGSIGDINFPGLTPTTIDNMTIGATTPAAATVTALTATSAKVDTGTKTATASSGAATLNKAAGVITSEALTTIATATYTLTLTDSSIAAADQVMASVAYGTATTGIPTVATVKPAAGSVVIVVQNNDPAAALNGTIKISFVDFKN